MLKSSYKRKIKKPIFTVPCSNLRGDCDNIFNIITVSFSLFAGQQTCIPFIMRKMRKSIHFLDIFDHIYTIKKQINANTTTWTT